MDDKARLWIAAALSILILILWQVFFEQPRQEAIKKRIAEQEQTKVENSVGQGQSSDVLSEAIVPDYSQGERSDSGSEVQEEGVQGEHKYRMAIQTDRVSGYVNLRGAKIDDLTLLDYKVSVDSDSANVKLLSPSGSENPYFMQLGWVGSFKNSDEKLLLPDYKTIWSVRGNKVLTDKDRVELFWENGQGVEFTILYSIDDAYMISYQQGVINNSGKSMMVRPYGLISRAGTPVTENFYILHEGFIGHIDGTLQEIDYTDISDSVTMLESWSDRGGWFGITDKYWLTALVPVQDQAVEYNVKASAYKDGDFRYQVDMLMSEVVVGSGEVSESRGHLFAGAKRVGILDNYEEKYSILSFDKAVDFGWLYFLTKPIFYLLSWIFGLVGNFGVSILLLTVIIKLIFFPLAQKAYKSTSRIKLLQPKMEDLKKKYGEDRQALSKAMMELYKQEGVNPLSGCLPIFLQLPVFFALYKVLFVTIEMRHAPFFGWINDLSVPDPLGILTLFGLIDWSVPEFLVILNIGIWPIIMGVTMWLQQKMQPTPPDPVQARIFAFLPIVFTFVLATFPAGLVIYWSWNNLLSIGQQALIMRRLEAASKMKNK